MRLWPGTDRELFASRHLAPMLYREPLLQKRITAGSVGDAREITPATRAIEEARDTEIRAERREAKRRRAASPKPPAKRRRRLADDAVSEIRRRLARGETAVAIARDFGLWANTVRRIGSGATHAG